MLPEIDFETPAKVLCFLSVFGVWKIVEIIIWIFRNVSIQAAST